MRLAVLDAAGALVAEQASGYPAAFEDPRGWRSGLIALCGRLPAELRSQVGAVAIDGTSGTLLLCHEDGSLLPGVLAQALPYHRACPHQAAAAARLTGQAVGAGPAASASGSLARALMLLAMDPGPCLLRHQADWLMGWLLGDWRWGEEGNNLRLGWDLQKCCWSGSIADQPWSGGLPQVRSSGERLGTLAAASARALGLPASCQVVAGSTDANAAVLAAGPEPSA